MDTVGFVALTTRGRELCVGGPCLGPEKESNKDEQEKSTQIYLM